LVKIRLKRMGTTKRPVYRLVVADSRSPRDGRFIESIGFYDPLPNPAVVRIDAERVQLWLKRGARPSDSARQLLVKEGILAARAFTVTVREAAPEPVKAKANGAAKSPAAAAEEAPAEAPETELEAEVAEAAETPVEEPAAETTPETEAADAGPSAESSEDAEATADAPAATGPASTDESSEAATAPEAEESTE
jgi:small subunit ribosomal protein S16